MCAYVFAFCPGWGTVIVWFTFYEITKLLSRRAVPCRRPQRHRSEPVSAAPGVWHCHGFHSKQNFGFLVLGKSPEGLTEARGKAVPGAADQARPEKWAPPARGDAGGGCGSQGGGRPCSRPDTPSCCQDPVTGGLPGGSLFTPALPSVLWGNRSP